jgi:tetratricopeptide (TPR) repeat protein
VPNIGVLFAGPTFLGLDAQEFGRHLRTAGIVIAALVAFAIGLEFYETRNVRHDVRERAESSEKLAQARQDELKRLLIETAGIGAPAVKAIADIRNLLRAGNPEIDAISDEQLPQLVQRIIKDLQKPAASPGDFTGAVKRTLEEAQAQAGELKFGDAAKTLDDAIAEAEAEDQNRARGRAALLASGARARREPAIALSGRSRLSRQGGDRDGLRFKPSLALHIFSRRRSSRARRDNAALQEAIVFYRIALNLAPGAPMSLEWGSTVNELGNALGRLGTRESETATAVTTLRQAVAAYHAALAVATREWAPRDWATTQNNLGNALKSIAEREHETATAIAMLQQAVAAFRAALEVRTREGAPLEWAQTQSNLGNVLTRLGGRETGTETVASAVTAYTQALRVYVRERYPREWADTTNNLGGALALLGGLELAAPGERERGTATLQRAVEACRAALEVRTHERFPWDWAMTQDNLGATLLVLGELESGTATLENAVAAFAEALQVRTRERAPRDWARSFGLQGAALILIAVRKNDAALAKKATEQVEAAYETKHATGDDSFDAYLDARLSEARALLQRSGGL